MAQGPPLQHDATAQAPMERVEQTIHGTRGLGILDLWQIQVGVS